MGLLDDKTIVVTGASRGIGADIASLFAAEGGRVLCVARTAKEGDHKNLSGSIATTVESIRAAGGVAESCAADLSISDEREKVIATAHQVFGPVDVLVTSALLLWHHAVQDYPLQRWMRSWEVNFQSVFHLSQLALQDMIPRRWGRMVHLSSGSSIGPGPGPYEEDGPIPAATCYGTQKAAVERFSQGLAKEVYKHGVGTAALSPTQVVATEGVLFNGVVPSTDGPEVEPPELIARAALLLCTAPLEQVAGRVAFSQQLLEEFGELDHAVPRRTGAYYDLRPFVDDGTRYSGYPGTRRPNP